MAALDRVEIIVVAAFEAKFLVPTLALIGALLLGAVIIAFLRRRLVSAKPLSSDASDQLAQFRSLYEQGAISEEEFKQLRSVLGNEIRQAVGASVPSVLPKSAIKTTPVEGSTNHVAPPVPKDPPADGMKPA